MKFRKKPIVIDAVQFLAAGEQTQAVRGMKLWPDERGSQPRDMSWGYIDTLEGRMHVHHGDWIICGVAGEFYPCKPEIFEATYEAVSQV